MLFDYFDTEGSGYITAKDLKNYAAKQGRLIKQNELELMINQIDQQKDGKIDFEEFKAMMNDIGVF